MTLHAAEPDEERDEALDLEERAEAFPDTQPVSYFGTDFDVDGLVRRLNRSDIIIPNFDPDGAPGSDLQGFQRSFVWRKYQMDRFIESLLLGYPIPGIFLVQRPDKKLLVLDGQQRLRSLQEFYGHPGRPGFALENVADAYVGARYDELGEEDRRTLDNTFIHATIVKYEPAQGGDDAVYQAFERLNTGGTNLTPHEIRVALYSGDFIRLLRDLNNDESWRKLYGPRSNRLKDQELILRFVAFRYNAAAYARPLKRFLNKFVEAHRSCEGIDVSELSSTFRDVCKLVLTSIGRRAFRATGQVNAALVDAVLFGVAARLDRGAVTEPHVLGEAFDALIADGEFLSAIVRATADEDRVARRLGLALEAFAGVA